MSDIGAYSIGDSVTAVVEVINGRGIGIAITLPTVEIVAEDNTVILASSAMVTAGEDTGRARFVFTLPDSLGTRIGETLRLFYTVTVGATVRQPLYDTIRISREVLIRDATELNAILASVPRAA